MIISRIMFAACRSGSGKTLHTCAFMNKIASNNNVLAFKCGPDYIDPMFHRTVQGIESENLDTWFLGEDELRSVFVEAIRRRADTNIAVMEGVMGLYDGLGGISLEGSSYDLARVTRTPIILIVDSHGMARTLVALIKGITDYDRDGLIKGVVLNRCSKNMCDILRPVIEEETGIEVLGYFPTRSELVFESRHLGLILPNEVEDIRKKIEEAGKQFGESVLVDRILEIADKAEEIVEAASKRNYAEHDLRPRLAVARDEAFCFYYDANLRQLEESGAELVYFSPLHDKHLPENIDGMLIGGGYPELYARTLSDNHSMMDEVRYAIEKGMPSLAECGGFMYLHRSIIDDSGVEHKLVGVIDGSVHYTGKSVRFGYASLSNESGDASGLLRNGDVIKGHEFHYYDSDCNGEDLVARKAMGNRSWNCCHMSDEHLWGFAHLYYPSCPQICDNFVESMRRYNWNINCSIIRSRL